MLLYIDCLDGVEGGHGGSAVLAVARAQAITSHHYSTATPSLSFLLSRYGNIISSYLICVLTISLLTVRVYTE